MVHRAGGLETAQFLDVMSFESGRGVQHVDADDDRTGRGCPVSRLDRPSNFTHDAFDRREDLVLPHTDDAPSGGVKGKGLRAISRRVGCELACPELLA